MKTEVANQTAYVRRKMDRFERILKDLDVTIRTARAGLHGAQSVDDKVRVIRVQRILEKARNDLRKQLFEFEDAAKFAEIQKEYVEANKYLNYEKT